MGGGRDGERGGGERETDRRIDWLSDTKGGEKCIRHTHKLVWQADRATD